MIETLFAQQKDWVVQKPLQPMFAIAKQAGFTQQSFDECLANQQMLDGIEEIAHAGGQQVQRHLDADLLHQRQDLPWRPDAGRTDKQIAPYLKG